jgi:hypothetical protein
VDLPWVLAGDRDVIDLRWPLTRCGLHIHGAIEDVCRRSHDSLPSGSCCRHIGVQKMGV